MLAPSEFSMILSSDPLAGSSNLTADGSRFEVRLNTPISIPREARSATLTMETANVWWVISNISADLGNNRLFLHGLDTSDVEKDFSLAIPDGLYSVEALNRTVQQLVSNLDGKVSPVDNFEITADNATSKIVINLSYPSCTVDFTQANTLRTVLGFNSQTLGPYTGAPEFVYANTTAAFAPVSSFLVHSDLVSGGIPIGPVSSQVIGEVLIDVPPGSQITSAPFRPPASSIANLVGSTRDFITMWLTDQNNRPIDTGGEYWSCRITLRWLTPLFVTH
jgi:hypothetical protein